MLKQAGASEPEGVFGAEITADFWIPRDLENRLLANITDQFHATIVPRKIREDYFCMEE